MGLSSEQLCADLDALARIEPRYAAAIRQAGYPEPRTRAKGYATLLRTIVGQQVSFKAADAVWAKLAATLGDLTHPRAVLMADDEMLRSCGLSRQKQGYARSLATLIDAGDLPLHDLPIDDEEAITLLTQVKGIGRWSAEVYLLFAEGRRDIWPAGDLAVQVDVSNVLGLTQRPSEKIVRELAEPWRPYRGAAAIFAWHHYQTPTI